MIYKTANDRLLFHVNWHVGFLPSGNFLAHYIEGKTPGYNNAGLTDDPFSSQSSLNPQDNCFNALKVKSLRLSHHVLPSFTEPRKATLWMLKAVRELIFGGILALSLHYHQH